MKSNYKYVVFFVVGFLIGAFWYRLQLFPIPQMKHFKSHRTSVSQYFSGDSIFYDRSYFDESGNINLNKMFLIKLTRHRNFEDLIVINAKVPLTVYRIISKMNENNFLHQYELTNIKVSVIGDSSSHEEVIKKYFLPGVIKLSPGKGLSSTPILVSHSLGEKKQDEVFEILESFYSFKD